MNPMPVQALKQLLTGVSGHGNQHLSEVEADLQQTALLLSEAIETLSASFNAIHAAVAAQQLALDELLAAQGVQAEAAQPLRQLREEIGEQVGTAITAMQFQDMTSQLIGRMLKRIDGLRDLLAPLENGQTTMPHADEHEALSLLLHNMHERVRDKSQALNGGLRQSVKQQHMASGDVELF